VLTVTDPAHQQAAVRLRAEYASSGAGVIPMPNRFNYGHYPITTTCSVSA
jgi:hypothetical protein